MTEIIPVLRKIYATVLSAVRAFVHCFYLFLFVCVFVSAAPFCAVRTVCFAAFRAARTACFTAFGAAGMCAFSFICFTRAARVAGAARAGAASYGSYDSRNKQGGNYCQ